MLLKPAEWPAVALPLEVVMRRFSRRSGRRRGSKARKSYWNGMTFSGHDLELANAGFGEVATLWAKWPSGLINFSGGSATDTGEGFVEANDETWVRAIASANCTLDLQGMVQSSYQVTGCFGLIAWEASNVTAVDLDVAVQPSGVVPNPARDWAADWIIRLPFSFTRDNFSIGNIAETFIVSRAMRKLPPRTGVLCAFGYEAILLDPGFTLTWDFQLDLRYLLKSGYYLAG